MEHKNTTTPWGGCVLNGHDVQKSGPEKWLKFADIDKSIQELRVIYKAHPEWFEVPKPKSDKGQDVVDYSVKG